MSAAVDYSAFLASKALAPLPEGLRLVAELPSALFGFQAEAVQWALERGRAALFFDCGLGKTAMQVSWGAQVAAATGRPVLILAPLAVSQQTVREGEKFGVAVKYCAEAADVAPGVNITNYERLPKFDPSVFGGVVLDESSILKAYTGATKRRLVEAFAATPFRLCCSATPAPNDHQELGNHAEFLGVMTSHEMLARWFLSDYEAGHYRLKGHAIGPFWDWVTSWARCAGKPSDVGHSDAGFVLPALRVLEHVVDVDQTEGRGDNLFRVADTSATGVHCEKRRTAGARAAALAELVRAEPGEQWLIWTDTDYEADALTEVLPEATDVRGSDRTKETALLAFADGELRVLVTKPKLAGLGMNFQRCARVAFVGPSFSFEQYYQAVRRVWRFGQKRDVHAHVFLAATEVPIWSIVRRKADAHDSMKREMFAAARRAREQASHAVPYLPTHEARLPTWLRSA